MIGFVCGEDWTAFEFRPIFASNKMKWAAIVINKPVPDKYWGEWGFAFTRRGDICVFKGNEMRYKRPLNWIKRLYT
jgi:hypothetical protein